MFLFRLKKNHEKNRTFFQKDWLKNPEYKDCVLNVIVTLRKLLCVLLQVYNYLI